LQAFCWLAQLLGQVIKLNLAPVEAVVNWGGLSVQGSAAAAVDVVNGDVQD
jgi:hypothetical protein